MRVDQLASILINRAIDKDKPYLSTTLQETIYYVAIEYYQKYGEEIVPLDSFFAYSWGAAILEINDKYDRYWRIYDKEAVDLGKNESDELLKAESIIEKYINSLGEPFPKAIAVLPMRVYLKNPCGPIPKEMILEKYPYIPSTSKAFASAFKNRQADDLSLDF